MAHSHASKRDVFSILMISWGPPKGGGEEAGFARQGGGIAGARARGGGRVLAPGFGTHCETDPESGGGDSRDRRALNAPYPYILEEWDISKGAYFNIMALKSGHKGNTIIAIRMQYP